MCGRARTFLWSQNAEGGVDLARHNGWERQIGESLQRVTPHMTAARRTNMPGLHANPVPYLALSFGHKVHMDQNEKLAMYGVTHVAARDGYSGKVVGFATMPRKNNVTIYEDVYRPMVLQYGLRDQVRVDHGREFYLCLAVQEHLSEFRSNTQRTPTVQSSSRMNLVIERLWPEINMRVNYPIKTALNSMVAEDLVSMDNEDDVHRFNGGDGCGVVWQQQVCRGMERTSTARKGGTLCVAGS